VQNLGHIRAALEVAVFDLRMIEREDRLPVARVQQLVPAPRYLDVTL